MADNDPMIGRQNELAMLEEALKSGRPALVLLVGGPATGKGQLLKELRERATAYPCMIVPSDPGDVGAPWLVVNKQSTVADFQLAMPAPNEAAVSRGQLAGPYFDMVLMYGYRPQEDVHRWFTREFLPGLAETSPPRIVVVAASADDLVELDGLEDRRIVLEPLSREEVVTALHTIDAAIDDKLDERELDMYANAIVADPSVIGALRHVLPLTHPGPAAECLAGEE